MIMGTPIELSGDEARIVIDVLGYENTRANDVDDANWLMCRVAVRVGPLSAKIEAAFTTSDFTDFRQSVEALLSGINDQASFATHEEALEIHLSRAGSGRIRVTGTARTFQVPGGTLSFSFDSDHPALEHMHRDVAGVINQYPYRSAP
jgi:hypothetical protein